MKKIVTINKDDVPKLGASIVTEPTEELKEKKLKIITPIDYRKGAEVAITPNEKKSITQ